MQMFSDNLRLIFHTLKQRSVENNVHIYVKKQTATKIYGKLLGICNEHHITPMGRVPGREYKY